MKSFDPFAFDLAQCAAEVKEFDALLARNAPLKERTDILPFFRKRRQLSAFCGAVTVSMDSNRVAWELDLFGDYSCDLAFGQWGQSFCLVEFEDAKADSIFKKA